jgi:hypothetical protein
MDLGSSTVKGQVSGDGQGIDLGVGKKARGAYSRMVKKSHTIEKSVTCQAEPEKEDTMKKMSLVLALAMALSAASLVFAQDGCTVSGEVVYSGDSSIYVCLLNSKTFAPALGRHKELPPPEFLQIVKANPSGKASFAFKDVPKGEYIVQAFADENNNGKLDTDAMGVCASEPLDWYKPVAERFHHNWSEQKFDADKDVTGIVVNLA